MLLDLYKPRNIECVVVCSSLHTHKSPGSRKGSITELGVSNHPGDLLSRASQRRRAPPFLKRYTIADFANTRAYQESTASLISASAEHGPFTPTSHNVQIRIQYVVCSF